MSGADIFVIIMLILCAMALILPVVFLIIGIVKRRKKMIKTVSIILAAEILLVVAYSVLFPTCFPYVDLYIIGRTKAEITAVYGEPNYKFREKYGYFIGKDNGFFGLMKSNNDFYYYIYFDENGIAKSVEEGIQPGG